MNDLEWMKRAFKQALKAREQAEVPVGAVLVSSKGVLLAESFNQMIGQSDPTAHAEMTAIRDAAQKISSPRLIGSTLYVTLEPCPMCASAMVHARIARLVFACRDLKTGAAGSVFNLLRGFPLNHQVTIDEGILYQPCSELLTAFFQERRQDKR